MTTAHERYASAAHLYTSGRFGAAADILAQLTAEEPANIESRHALAMCQLRLDRSGEAIANFRRIVEQEPGQFEDAYRLGVALEAAGAYGEAADAFRLVLTHSEHRDARQRLGRCETAGTPVSPTAVFPASPRAGETPHVPLRRLLDERSVAERGAFHRTLRQQTRYLIPSAARTFLLAVGITVLLVALSAVPPDWLAVFAGTAGRATRILDWLRPVVAAAAWLAFAGHAAFLWLRAHLCTVDVFDRGIDVARGVVNRKKQFIWFYQMPLEPTYLRSGLMFLTRTASLRLKYNELATNELKVELRGIGTPAVVDELRAYIERRRLAERMPIRGPFS